MKIIASNHCSETSAESVQFTSINLIKISEKDRMGLIERASSLLRTLQLVLYIITIPICVFTMFARYTQLRGYLADRIARAKIRYQTEKVVPIPFNAVSLKPYSLPSAKTKTLTNNQRFPLVSCLLSLFLCGWIIWCW